MVINSIVKGVRTAIYVASFLFSAQPLYSGFDARMTVEIESAYRTSFGDNMGFTLIGAKPVSVDELQDFYLNTHPEVLKGFISSIKDLFKDADKFVLKVFEFEGSYEIELIHKDALRSLVAQSASLMEYIKDNFSNEHEFYVAVEDVSTSIFSVIDSELIMGIILGYGEENCLHHCRMREIGGYLKKYQYSRYFRIYTKDLSCLFEPTPMITMQAPHKVQKPELGIGFNSLDEEWEWLMSVNLCLKKEYAATPPFFINLPFYRSKRCPESDALRAKYIRARAKLAKIFSGKSYKQAVEDEVRRKYLIVRQSG